MCQVAQQLIVGLASLAVVMCFGGVCVFASHVLHCDSPALSRRGRRHSLVKHLDTFQDLLAFLQTPIKYLRVSI